MDITDIQDALQRLRIAENHFNEAMTPNQVGMATYEYNEALRLYDEAIRRAKAQAAALPNRARHARRARGSGQDSSR
jgi:predicted translin family RNA/ssDNA-binding protein